MDPIATINQPLVDGETNPQRSGKEKPGTNTGPDSRGICWEKFTTS